jgi:hypothetical protein
MALVMALRAPRPHRGKRPAIAGIVLALAGGIGFQCWRVRTERQLVRVLGDIKIEIPAKTR